MAEIEITLPTIQYGNIKITATPEEWGLDAIADAPDVGVWAATYLNLFIQGFKHGSTLDVDAHLGAPQGVTEAQAQRMLDEGLGGVTEVSDEGAAPWDKPAAEVKKPWETGTSTPDKVVEGLGSGW